ncbi:MAG: tRNA (guanosine(46)-N7)-methyltransferase TrmB [Sphaerochaetaceae bacterium]|nr:tRNA (guanosine(46)-N7)-methyltransferase TrmB [Sphaerochaetaceae bacterium]
MTADTDLTIEKVIEHHPAIDIVEIPPEDRRREVKSFVLRGQKLGTHQLEALDRSFDKYCLTYSPKPFDFEKIFGNRNPVVIEIGFGMGESTLKIASDHPEINYIGFEVFLFGFSKLLYNIEKAGITNLRIMRFDARQAIASMVPQSSISGFHIFFPDPWPKKRHHGRRLIQSGFVELLSSRLVSSGYIYAATDWEDYAKQMLEVLSACPSLKNAYDGFAGRIPWRPETGFERKGLAKSYEIHELWFVKK